MNFFPKYIGLILISILVSLTVNSQVSVKASVDRDKILIGEPITLTLQAYTPLGEAVSWFPLDTIPGFEFIRKGKLDTIENVDNKKLEQTLIITSFDSGTVVFPPLEMKVGDRTYLTDSLPIDVAYINFDPAADYRDIKAIAEVEDNTIDYLPWIIGVITIIAIGLIVWLVKKEKKVQTQVEPGTPALPPYEQAMAALSELEKMDLDQPGSAKIYYTELNDIFRVYVYRALGLTSLEKTNDELILQLRQSGMGNENFSQLAQVLRMSDFVKFARYQPEKKDNNENLVIIRTSIRTLNNLDNQNKNSEATAKLKTNTQ